MTVYNTCSRQIRRVRRPRSLSWYSEDSDEGHPKSLEDEIDDIYSSLDTLEDNINSQQFTIAREFEDHVRHVYEDVLGNIKGIREKVKSISDLVSASKKIKQWGSSSKSNRGLILNDYNNKLKVSQSLDDLESTNTLCQMKNFSTFPQHSCSTYSLHSKRSRKRTRQVQVYGCCFYGDNKFYPYRTHKTKYLSKNDCLNIICGPRRSLSRSGSRSTVEDSDDDSSCCMRGDIADDWRIKVTPYLWDGWNTPGLDKVETAKYKERLKKLLEFRNDLLQVQNLHRYRHGCPELVLSDVLSRDSQEWANMLALMGYAQYSEISERGENILVVDIEYELTGRQVADMWYREGRFFDYNNCHWQKGSRNFTQMIWKSSKLIGIGIAKLSGRNTYVIVAQYYPAGNTNNSGDFQENVPPVKHFESTV